MPLIRTTDVATSIIVLVEVPDGCNVVGGLPWWWARIVPSQMQAVTCYPTIANRDPAQPWSLEGLLHELAHWDDQRTAQAQYGAGAWYARYLWRWVWSGFNYHTQGDEKGAVALAKKQRDHWESLGTPAVYTIVMRPS